MLDVKPSTAYLYGREIKLKALTADRVQSIYKVKYMIVSKLKKYRNQLLFL